MVYRDNLRWYEFGKKSTQAFKNAARAIVEGKTVSEIVGESAPYLCGQPEALDELELSAILEWLEQPEGPPPSSRFLALRRMLVECRNVLDDRELERMAEEADRWDDGF